MKTSHAGSDHCGGALQRAVATVLAYLDQVRSSPSTSAEVRVAAIGSGMKSFKNSGPIVAAPVRAGIPDSSNFALFKENPNFYPEAEVQ